MRIARFLLSVAAIGALVGVANVDFGTNSAAFAQDAAIAQAGSETPKFDESFFDVEENESTGYYRDRLAAFEKANEEFSTDPKVQKFFEENEAKAQTALQTIFKRLIDDPKTPEEERDRCFERYANSLVRENNIDEIQSLYEKYSAKDGGDPTRASSLQYLLYICKLREAGDDAAKLTALAAEIQASTLKDENFAPQGTSLIRRLRSVDAEVGAKALENLYAAFNASDSDVLKSIAKRLEGALRFANLVGNEMKVEGLLLDGKTEIDWASYRGKVVLVDFWATWCGPCVGEIPNVQAMYEKYNAAGFEVLGYSLDQDLDALKKFEEEKKLPWATASRKLSVDAEKEYVDLTEYYGINGIPTMVLVGKDGKVIDTNARGEHLQELLKEQFPDVK